MPATNPWRARIGKRGEELARLFLEQRGYRILSSNYRCQWGEVDIIAQDRDTLVFVEVKLRRSRAFGVAEEAVSRAKAQKLIRCAEQYTSEQNLNVPWRIDLVAIQLEGGNAAPRTTLIQNAVTGDD